MLFRLLYEDQLAAASYLIGCQRTGDAILIDPLRDVDRACDAARRENLRIRYVAETHIHADFLSGAREFVVHHGAQAILSGEGGADWSYRWPEIDRQRIVRHGETIEVGGIVLEVMHTPGHTPEHVSYLVTDRGGGATEPMGLLSGDFVFVGDLGRPDLLETAAGETGAAEPAAALLHASAVRFLDLPDHLQVWPGHGAGSACGKALGAVPQSTVGYERRTNAALRSVGDAAIFTRGMLEGQPDPPLYFARMKRDNRNGPQVLAALPEPEKVTTAGEIARVTSREDVVIVDTRPFAEFRTGHLPGSISAPFTRSFTTVIGSFLQPRDEIVLIAESDACAAAVRCCVRIGLDRVAASITPEALSRAFAEGAPRATMEEIDPDEAARRLAGGAARVLDVRGRSEFAGGHIAGAQNIPHTRLAAHLDDISSDHPLVVQCLGGGRSAAAASLLARRGFRVANLAGGITAWQRSGKPVEA